MKTIFTWNTGCWKTYTAILKARELWKFIYLAPCRQLTYETWSTYSNSDDFLSTGEIKINKIDNVNFFGVYESGMNIDLKQYKTLIIDEAHFLSDKDRGAILFNLIKEAQNLRLNIFLLTATLNFKLNGFEVVKLPSRGKIVKKYKELHEYEELKWEKFLFFVPSMKVGKWTLNSLLFEGFNVELMHSNVNPSDRIKIQRKFAEWTLDWVICTNVLAQWINFPATAIVIPTYDWDWEEHKPEIYNQIIWRAGRIGWSDRATIYYDWTKKKKVENKKIVNKEKKVEKVTTFVKNNLTNERNRLIYKIIEENKIDVKWANNLISDLIYWYDISEYSDIKYWISLIRAIASSKYKDKFINIDYLMKLIEEENEKTRQELEIFREKFNIFNKKL